MKSKYFSAQLGARLGARALTMAKRCGPLRMPLGAVTGSLLLLGAGASGATDGRASPVLSGLSDLGIWAPARGRAQTPGAGELSPDDFAADDMSGGVTTDAPEPSAQVPPPQTRARRSRALRRRRRASEQRQDAYAANDPDSVYFNRRELPLTPQEETAMRALETNRPHSRPTSKPVVGQDGSIRFMFGSQHTSILCAPLQVCDVALQPGEHVSSVNLGDTARWSVEPAITGIAPQEVQHLIIKPADVGLETSLVVTTDRRTYHLRLRSHRTKFMPSVSFLYPEDAEAKWAALRRSQGGVGGGRHGSRARRIDLARSQEVNLGSLSFNYEIDGDDPPWKPLRVYNDGFKTVIEMPYAMRHTEAPALLVVRADGGLFSEDETVIVNYRVHDTKYIVDSIFDKAILISGVGSDQEKVTITRE